MNKKISIIILILMLVVCLAPTALAFAEVTTPEIYVNVSGASDVLEDLSNDQDFDASEWTMDNTNCSLEVITIAEGVDKALYVYVYQPCLNREPLATSINMGLEVNTVQYKNYGLTFVNRNGVFVKYLVNNFVISSATQRYYEIISIYRNFIEGVDATVTDNTVNEVAFPVGGAYKFDSLGLTYSEIELITVTSQYVGFVRYMGNNVWAKTYYLDSHFIAFSTDKRIDYLLEADIYCEKQHIIWKEADDGMGDPIVKRDDIEPTYCHMDYTQHGKYEGKGWTYDNEYEWQVISTAQDFLAKEDRTSLYKGMFVNATNTSKIDDLTYELIENEQWVIRFLDTPYSYKSGLLYNTHDYYSVTNVTLLRLAFKTDGNYYNLGVVSNKQTGSGLPDNETTIDVELNDLNEFEKWFKLLGDNTAAKLLSVGCYAFMIVALVICAVVVVSVVFPKE